MPETPQVTKNIERLLQQIKLYTGQEEVSLAKRDTGWHMWATPATVEFVDPKYSSEPLYITTRTISAQGLDFRSPRRLKRGCKVLITLETAEGQTQIPATVMDSTESIGMPIVGVAFDLG